MSEGVETIIELNEDNEIEPTYYIEVGILFDGDFIRRRLNVKEKDLCVETIGFDIKKIMHQLKKKQEEILNDVKKTNR